MAKKRVTAEVCVQLTVMVYIGNWDAESSFSTLEDQANREARNKLEEVLGNNQCKILGNPGVMNVTIKEQK